MADQIVILNDNNFEQEIAKNQFTLVDFWAEWCGPCKAIAPILSELASEFAGKASIAKVDVDQNPAISAKYGIRSIPTLLLFKEGKLVATKVGALPKSELVKFLIEHISA